MHNDMIFSDKADLKELGLTIAQMKKFEAGLPTYVKPEFPSHAHSSSSSLVFSLLSMLVLTTISIPITARRFGSGCAATPVVDRERLPPLPRWPVADNRTPAEPLPEQTESVEPIVDTSAQTKAPEDALISMALAAVARTGVCLAK